jgi:hypothetical protein
MGSRVERMLPTTLWQTRVHKAFSPRVAEDSLKH